MQITVEIKSVYGVERIYAVCNNAKLITKLKQSKTLSKDDISILRELGYTIQTKQPTIQKEKMKIKINDVFGFQKAINFDKLDNPETLDLLSKMFNVNNERPEKTYKKAVSSLKAKVKKI